MTFETQVMAVVSDTLGTSEMDGFCSGTLFVTCFPEEARQLLATLNEQFGPVQVTPQRGHMEFAFDFTA
jgi:hypothetical protein